MYFIFLAHGALAKPTRGEIVVLIWILTLLSLGLGAYYLWLGFSVPPEETEYASTAKQYGVAFLVAGPLLWVGHRIIHNLLHR